MNLLEEIRKFRELVLRKQDRLTPGAHITIDEDNVISADIGGAEELEGRVEALEEETENLDIRMDGAEYVVTVLSDDLDVLQQKVDNIHGFNIIALKDGEFDPQTLIPSIEDPLENTLYLVPNVGDSDKNLWVEWLWIKGAWEQFGSATIDLNKYVKKTDYANSTTAGVVKTSAVNGVETNSSGQLIIKSANQADVVSGTSLTLPLTPGMQHYAAFYGLARAAKAPTLSYTSQDKVAIRLMIDAGSHAQVEELATSVIYIEDKTKDIINKTKTTEPGKIWMSNEEGAGWSDVPIGTVNNVYYGNESVVDDFNVARIPLAPSKTSDLLNDSGFITVEDVPESGVQDVTVNGVSVVNEDMIAELPSIPAKTSELTNDSGFITEKEIPEIPTKTSELINDSGFITEEDIPDVPTKVSELINDSGFVTADNVPTKVSDLTNDSGFVTDADVPKKTSELTNDSGFVTSDDVPTKVSDLTNDAGFITENDIPAIPSKTSELTNDSGFITKAVVPSKTSDLTNDSNFITEASVPTKVSDLENDTGFITEEDIPEIPSKTSDLTNDSGFVTEEDVPTKTSDLVNDSGFITRGDIPESGVLDVKVDGVSVVDETTGSANIETSEFGKVRDVTVDGTSVLDEETGVAEIPKIPENTSDLQNDSGYITMEDLEPGVNVTQDDNGDIKITGLGGGISEDIELELERLRNQMNSYYNELKALIQSYHPNPPGPTVAILDEAVLGTATLG